MSTSAALKGISLTCSNNPQLAESAASLRPQDLKAYFDWQLLSLEARVNFLPAPQLPAELNTVQSLLSTVKLRGCGKIPGSNAERELNRLKLESMTLANGTSDFFFTLTPMDTGSMLLAFYAGAMPNVMNLDYAKPEDMPNKDRAVSICCSSVAAPIFTRVEACSVITIQSTDSSSTIPG